MIDRKIEFWLGVLLWVSSAVMTALTTNWVDVAPAIALVGLNLWAPYVVLHQHFRRGRDKERSAGRVVWWFGLGLGTILFLLFAAPVSAFIVGVMLLASAAAFTRSTAAFSRNNPS